MGADVVVIGGGIIGCSITYYLSRRGFKVIDIERNDLASGASSWGQGVIGGGTPLVRASAQLYRTLSDELSADIHYSRRGSLDFIANEDDLPRARQAVEDARKNGDSLTFLSQDEVRAMEPGVARDVVGGVAGTEAGNVSPMYATFAFARAARKLGAELRTRTQATGIRVRGGKVQAVVTDHGEIPAPVVVNAAGVWAPLIGQMLEIDIPVIPRRGHILVTESTPPCESNVTVYNEWGVYGVLRQMGPKAKDHPDVRVRQGVAWNMVRTGDDNYLIGTSRDFAGFDVSTRSDVLQALAERTVRFLPRFQEVSCIRGYAGVRQYSPDVHPILGPVDEVEGFFVATGLEGEGIMTAPAVGTLISEAIADGQTSLLPLDEFLLSRFKKGLAGDHAV